MQVPHLKIKPFSFNCGASPSALSNADDAADAATLGAAAGRAQAASGAVACPASAAMAWTGASAWSVESCQAHGDASGDASREGRGQARGEAIAMGLCGPAPKHPRTPKAERGPPKTGLHEGYNPTAEGAASNRWPGSKRCRCGWHAPG